MALRQSVHFTRTDDRGRNEFFRLIAIAARREYTSLINRGHFYDLDLWRENKRSAIRGIDHAVASGVKNSWRSRWDGPQFKKYRGKYKKAIPTREQRKRCVTTSFRECVALVA